MPGEEGRLHVCPTVPLGLAYACKTDMSQRASASLMYCMHGCFQHRPSIVCSTTYGTLSQGSVRVPQGAPADKMTEKRGMKAAVFVSVDAPPLAAVLISCSQTMGPDINTMDKSRPFPQTTAWSPHRMQHCDTSNYILTCISRKVAYKPALQTSC